MSTLYDNKVWEEARELERSKQLFCENFDSSNQNYYDKNYSTGNSCVCGYKPPKNSEYRYCPKCGRKLW